MSKYIDFLDTLYFFKIMLGVSILIFFLIFVPYVYSIPYNISCNEDLSSGNYLLQNDTNCTTGNSIFQASNKDNIIIDCNGHTLKGIGTTNGININNISNFDIRNCNIILDEELLITDSDILMIKNNDFIFTDSGQINIAIVSEIELKPAPIIQENNFLFNNSVSTKEIIEITIISNISDSDLLWNFENNNFHITTDSVSQSVYGEFLLTPEFNGYLYWNVSNSGTGNYYNVSGYICNDSDLDGYCNNIYYSLGSDFLVTNFSDYYPLSKPYIQPIIDITNCTELQNISNNPNLNYTLINDIDCSDTINWNSGTGFKPIEDFSGGLDGNGYTISDLYINNSGGSGLFYNLSGTVYIHNITFDRPKIISDSTSATILVSASYGVYQQSGGTINIYDCNVYNGSISGTVTGGIIGIITKYSPRIYDIKIIDTNLTDSNSYAGGLIGRTYHSGAGEIERIYFKGNIINTTGSYKGGIIGYTRDNSDGVNKGWKININEIFVAEESIIECHGDCTYVGGLVGYAYHNSLNQVSNIRYGISHADIKIIGNGTQIGGALGRLQGSGSSGDRMRLYYVLFTGNINVTGVENYVSGITGLVGSKARTYYSFYDTDKTSQITAVNGSNDFCYGNKTLNLYYKSVYENNNWDFTTPYFDIYDGCYYPYIYNIPLSEKTDVICPLRLNIIHPLNESLFNLSSIFNGSILINSSKNNLNNCTINNSKFYLYQLNNNTVEFRNNTELSYNSTDFYSLLIYCNDTDNLSRDIVVSFTLDYIIPDTTPPNIIIDYPNNNSIMNNISWNGSIILTTNENSTCNINGFEKIFSNNSINHNFYNISLDSGNYNITIVCFDTLNNSGQTMLSFELDFINPNIISNNSIESIQNINLSIVTDEITRVDYFYGFACGVPIQNKNITGYNTNHLLQANNLNDDTNYYFNITIYDIVNNSNNYCINVTTSEETGLVNVDINIERPFIMLLLILFYFGVLAVGYLSKSPNVLVFACTYGIFMSLWLWSIPAFPNTMAGLIGFFNGYILFFYRKNK